MSQRDNAEDASRKSWWWEDSSSHDVLRTGCLQRIATAVENMGVEWRRMREAQSRAERLSAEVDRLSRSNAALRGYIKSKRAPKRARKAGK